MKEIRWPHEPKFRFAVSSAQRYSAWLINRYVLFVPQIGDKANDGLSKLLEKFNDVKYKGMWIKISLSAHSKNVFELIKLYWEQKQFYVYFD